MLNVALRILSGWSVSQLSGRAGSIQLNTNLALLRVFETHWELFLPVHIFWLSGCTKLFDLVVHMILRHMAINVGLPNLVLTHWSRAMHICVSKLTIIGSDNHLSPGRRQAIIWTIAGIFNCTLGNKLQWNFNRNSNICIRENAFENVVCEMASICLGLRAYLSS